MFTGLVEDIGRVANVERRSDAMILSVQPKVISVSELSAGDSVSHDGVCLTVTGLERDRYKVLAGAETLARTSLGSVRVGSHLHLERALRLSDRLGGHLVSGHVDGVGTLSRRRDEGANLVFTIHAAPALLRYIVHKGSIAVDGVSLTVNRVDGDGFDVALIPHTVRSTHFGDCHVGHRVNLEVDMIAKYVEKLMSGTSAHPVGDAP